MSASAAIYLGMALMTAAEAAPTDPAWQSVDSLDANFSFELPCSREAIEFRTEGFSGLVGSREARCTHRGVTFVVTIAQFPVENSEPAFDDLSERLFGNEREGVQSVQLGIAGYRSAGDRSDEDGLIGQRAIIEVNSSKVAMVMAGGISDASSSQVEFRAMIDRFFASLQVSS